MARETVELRGLRGVIETLQSLPPELVSKRGGPIAKAGKTALKPLRDAAKENVRRIVLEPNAHGLDGQSNGLLEKSIVITRDSRHNFKGEQLRVKVRRKAYPGAAGGKKRKARTTVKVGSLLEGGTEKMTAKPWIRPAYIRHRAGVLQTFETEVTREIAKVFKKLERLNKGKN